MFQIPLFLSEVQQRMPQQDVVKALLDALACRKACSTNIYACKMNQMFCNWKCHDSLPR